MQTTGSAEAGNGDGVHVATADTTELGAESTDLTGSVPVVTKSINIKLANR